jgi:hypothetical protein
MHGGLQIHVEYDMLITRHRDPKSHANYNQFQKVCIDWAIQTIISSESKNGKPLRYNEALDMEVIERHKTSQIIHKISTNVYIT